MFNLPLRNDEYNKLRHFRFVNIVICENIPQFIIQIIYLNIIKLDNQSTMVYISLIITLIGLLFSIQSELLHICHLCFHKE